MGVIAKFIRSLNMQGGSISWENLFFRARLLFFINKCESIFFILNVL